MTGARGASYAAPRGRHATTPDPTSAAPATTVVEAGTSVEGEIRATGDLVVRGRVSGHVAVDGTVRLEPGSEVRADIRAPRVVIVDGASFDGELDTLPAGTDAGSAPAPGPQAADSDPLSAIRRRVRLRGT